MSAKQRKRFPGGKKRGFLKEKSDPFRRRDRPKISFSFSEHSLCAADGALCVRRIRRGSFHKLP